MKRKHLVLAGSTLLTSAFAFANDGGAYHHRPWSHQRGRRADTITECTTVAPTSSPAPTGTPTVTPSSSPSPTATIFPLPTPSATPSASPIPDPSASPTPIATDMAPLASSAATAAGTDATASDPTTTDPGVGTSDPSGASRYKILFSRELFNGGMIAADTFLLDSQGRFVKQVGHSELSSPATQGQPPQEIQTQAQAQAQSQDASQPSPGEDQIGIEYKSDASSPFPFDLTITTGGDGRREVQLLSAGLFTGDTLSNLELRCR